MKAKLATLAQDAAILGEPPQVAAIPKYFEPDRVVSRDKEGSPLSRYVDNSWDYHAISSARETHLFFYEPPPGSNNPSLDALLHEQGKALVCQYLEGGAISAFTTVYRLNLVCIKWCKHARKHEMGLFEVLSHSEMFQEFLGQLSSVDIAQSSAIVTTLWKGRKRFGISPKLSELREIVRTVSAELPENQQTPLIPSKIYTYILGQLIAQLAVIDENLDIVLGAYRTCRRLEAKLRGEPDRNKRSAARSTALKPYMDDLIRLGYRSEGNNGSVENFVKGCMTTYQVTLMYVVIAFTGMRIGECLKLPVANVLVPVEQFGRIHWVINGFTHKLHKGIVRATSWVTSDEGKRAVELALRISDAVFEGQRKNVGKRLLFCSTDNAFKLKGSQQIVDGQARVAPLVCPSITQEDLNELEIIRLDRDWAIDGIAVGNTWPLEFHQLRRSLAVYAHRSGMVSLPSLKAQLQHITEEMALYYASGFSEAANVIFEEEHFSHEWNTGKAESAYFGMAFGLLLNNDELFGGGASWFLSDKVKNSPVSAHSREHALELFKKGQLAFKETPLGGCTSTERCNLSPLSPIQYECLETNCPNLVVFGKRLDFVISTQETVVAKLATTSAGTVEYRLEADNLQTLLNARKNLKRAGA